MDTVIRTDRSPLVIVAMAFLVGDGALTSASASTPCDLAAVDAAKTEFTRLSTLRRVYPGSVDDATVSKASLAYIAEAEACVDQLYGRASGPIDEDGITVDDGTAHHSLTGRKWGANTSFGATGTDNTGPGTAGGTVTYSFMANGIDMTGDSNAAAGANVSITSLPGYSACFLTDIAAAFAAWSAVANIQFVQVADGNAAFNAPGATADIRIGAHTFDGPSNTLAHAYYPPPNGTTASGDIHFDRQEIWGCVAGGGAIDIGIVALHEIGHALGLAHETRSGRRAVMNPTYNPSVASVLLGDDINGGTTIYGSSIGASDDLVLNFGSGSGFLRWNYGYGWTQIHSYAIQSVAVGDLDGSGVDDLVVDFGTGWGVWILMNNAGWTPLHHISPQHIAVGDLDGNGKDDVVFDFPGYGLWGYYNGSTWVPIHGLSAGALTVADIDGTGRDDLIVSFNGLGLWSFRNNSTWAQIHHLNAAFMGTGHFDTAAGAEDVLVSFPGMGLYRYDNGSSWVLVHGLNPQHVAVGDLDADGRDDLTVDFGSPYGVYTLKNGTVWTGLHGLSTKAIVMGDLDGNGQDEVVIDFGWVGVWAWVNLGSWIQIHAGTTVSDPMVVDFN